MPKLGRGLRVSCDYDYEYAAATKAVPREFVGAPPSSTMSADGKLVDGGKNWDVRSMSVQNVDTLKLSHHCKIEYDLTDIDMISCPKLGDD